ncbi:hypothetical protein F2Q70_00023220 [Brassica cretica]|uniref:DUF1985 domain-containing protein n=1 Tax=Brassica cretica TaxID=69181 RepID=A0A8S9GM48_BRACR|nr:hypothetical protein F2Q70_00023220 [Brassica cretica]
MSLDIECPRKACVLNNVNHIVLGDHNWVFANRTRVINFVQKDIGEMFPKWEFDVEDKPAENIIKLMFVKRPWKWTMDCWEVTGTWVNTKPTVASEEAPAEASEEVTTTVGGLTKEDIKTMFKDIVDAMREWFGTCLKEIKYLSERVEAVEKKVGITTKRKGTSSQSTTSPPKPTLEHGSESVNGTNAGRKSLPEDKCPDVPADAKGDARYQEKKDDALTLCRAKSYNRFAPIDKKKLKELADWLKTCPHYRTPLDKKPRTSRTWWYHILRTFLEWLEDCHIDAWINVLRKRYNANPQHFRSERMCFLDHLFA